MRRLSGAMPLDGLELGLFAAFAVVSLWVLGLDLWQVVAHGRAWTGTDGSYPGDQLQYAAWVRSASQHVLAANMFVLHGTSADYFQPAIALSGLLTALGLAPTVALLLWKPVAVGAVCLAARAFARRALPAAGRGPWLAVIALTLFYGCPSDVYGRLGVVGDLFPGFLSWGYPFALIGIAAAAFSLLAYTRARSVPRFSWAPGILAALAGAMHPWQGEVLILTVLGTELVAGGSSRAAAAWRSPIGLARSVRGRLTLATLLLAAAPLLNYAALDRLDSSWRLAEQASPHGFPAIATVLALAPLALVALLGYRGPAGGFLGQAVRVWPLAMLAVYLLSSTSLGSAPLHALDGVTLPLSVLAVDGCLRAGWRRLPAPGAVATALVLVFTVPATLYEMKLARDQTRPTVRNSGFITRDERRALDFLARDATAGGVLTGIYLGATVPGRTGRHTYVGHCLWSRPDCPARAARALALLRGRLAPARARAFVRGSGARFVLSDCADDADLTRTLSRLVVSVRRFGCAAVYELALAESARDAASVRAQRRQ
jgi:hypothetical protein